MLVLSTCIASHIFRFIFIVKLFSLSLKKVITTLMMTSRVVSDDILCGNRVVVLNFIEKPEIDGLTGQVTELSGDRARVAFDEGGATANIPIVCLENLPRRFAATMMKYSTRGFLKNWRSRYIEVWSNSLTYREENSPIYKGELSISPQTEIVVDFYRTAREKPPLAYSFGIMNDGKVFRICSDDENAVEEMKRAIQDAINDSVMYISG